MINIAAKLQNGDTALHIAAAMGRRKLTRVLLESGCSQGIKNKVYDSDTNVWELHSYLVYKTYI